MSDEFDDANEGEGKGIQNLRKEHDALTKQNKELLAQLSQFQAKERQSTVANVLKAKGLAAEKAAKAAKFYSGDDVSEESVGKWLEENADVFGVSSAPQGDPNAQNAQRVSAAAFGAADAVTNVPQNNQILGNPEEILHAINTLPMEELQKLGYMPANLNPFSAALDQ